MYWFEFNFQWKPLMNNFQISQPSFFSSTVESKIFTYSATRVVMDPTLDNEMLIPLDFGKPFCFPWFGLCHSFIFSTALYVGKNKTFFFTLIITKMQNQCTMIVEKVKGKERETYVHLLLSIWHNVNFLILLVVRKEILMCFNHCWYFYYLLYFGWLSLSFSFFSIT